MAKQDWQEAAEDWENRAEAAGWSHPGYYDGEIDRAVEKAIAEKMEDMRTEAFDAVAREFERLVALDEMPRRIDERVVQVIQNEARYGR